jgi:EAL domain-containing protein (putative c-di-GMP-specific phosphodiesterase class I)
LNLIPNNDVSPRTARVCYLCIEHDGIQAVKVEGYVYAMPPSHSYDVLKLLEAAVPEKQLILHYQPVCDLATGEICGYEALARWKRGDKIFGPSTFLPYLDGQLERQWVKQQVEQVGFALDALPSHLWISLNASKEVLSTALLSDLLKSHRHLKRIRIEVLESTSLSCSKELEILNQLCKIGIVLEADDVGNPIAGGGLDRLFQGELFSVVKLDGGLIDCVLEDESRAIIAKHLLAMAFEAGMETIAEWVTTPAQAKWLLDQKCTMGQGQLYGMAAPLPEMAQEQPTPEPCGNH